MKKILAFILCVILLVSIAAFASCDNDTVQTDELVVYNWADYIYDYEDDFKKYYKEQTGNNISITYVTFDTNETMLTKITKGDANVDVICPSEYAIQKLLESDALVPLYYFDEQKYTLGLDATDYQHNSDNIDERIVNKISEAFGSISVGDGTANMVDYFVPYMYGTLGILYNKAEFRRLGIYDSEVMNKANWGILFNDDGSGNVLAEELTGSILMKDSIRDSYVATLFYLLESGQLDGKTYADQNSPLYGRKYTDMPISELINAVDGQLVELCQQALVKQKQELFGYEVDFGKDDLLKGNAMVDLAWSGDAMYAVEESWNDELWYEGMECPECGTQTVTDNVCPNCGKVVKGDYELAYYVPRSAGNIWFDGWVVPKTYNKDHLTAIKLFINFLNTPYVAAENMLEIGYSSAISGEAVRNDADARSTLSAAYYVYDPEYWDMIDAEGAIVEQGQTLTKSDCEYSSWEEFCEYFFDYRDEIDDSNWRYPFEVSENETYDRSINTLGVMRDFGANNKQVVTMWNYARSAGITALPLFLWTLLALAVVCGIVFLALFIKNQKAKRVIISKESADKTDNQQ